MFLGPAREGAGGTPKSLVLGRFEHWTEGRRKRLFAVVSEALKYSAAVEDIIGASGILEAEKELPKDVALVLVYELLFGKEASSVGSSSRFGAMVARHRTRLFAEQAKLKVKRGVTSDTELAARGSGSAASAAARDKEPLLPRYVRINVLRASVNRVLSALADEGFESGFGDFSDLENMKAVFPDEHIPNLFLLPPRTALHNSALLTNGEIIIQDKASCFSAHCLDPPPGSVVMDCCAAPGNKTTHLAAIMGDRGVVYAVERDEKRCHTLRSFVKRAGAKCIRVKRADFLALDPKAFADVSHMLLDPSCSGSGIVGRTDYGPAEDDVVDNAPDRLAKLADFQAKALCHAMSFSNARRIAYSTCSVHAVENEEVVKRGLNFSDANGLGWKLSPALPEWPRRGQPIAGFDGHELVARTLPVEDRTIGFFVALFERPDSYFVARA
ncbi:S-adenosyl-L-methionine-dependent methyltransferase [Hyaloraphidium curvatum]|nr:S-adenosyl-L-methionine-dependent methyltransferase [Hyaloraphidium curvatum]